MSPKRILLSACLSLSFILSLLPENARPLAALSPAFVGKVTHIATGQAIIGARVGAAGRWAITDSQGRYRLSLPAGVYDVRAEARDMIGMTHVRQELAERDVTLDFEMIPLHPSPSEEAAIASKFMHAEQGAPDEDELAALSRGYGLSMAMSVPRTLRVLMPDGSVVVMEMDEYLKGVVPNEVPASWPAQALRAQAVAARSYAATRRAHAGQGADVCTTTHCQVWRSTHYDTSDAAVNDTHATAVTYNGQIIQAFFHAHCDGHTRNSEDVWGGYLPYCRSVACPCGYTSMYGHGVGMCQWGAKALAEQGKSYEEILKHYYTGIQVSRATPGRIENAAVQPESGDTNTFFTYELTYSSLAGDAPAVVNVVIDGRARALERVAQEATDRWRYRLVTRLSAGQHDFRFYADDGRGHVSRLPSTGTFQGPAVSQATPLTLTPTPPTARDGDVLQDSITHSTPDDWAAGTFEGVQIVPAGDGALALLSGRARGIYTSTVLTASIPFVALGLTWHISAPARGNVSFEVRTRAPGMDWTSWQPMAQSEEERGRGVIGRSELRFGLGLNLQYRVTLEAAADGSSPTLENVRWVCLDTRAGPTAAALAAARQTANGGPPPIIPRSGWGANESWMTWPPEYRTVRAMVIHHTDTSDGGVDPAAVVRAIYYYHAVTLEWGDIGYNFLVDRLGNIYEGRAGGPGVVGGHAREYNWGSIGIALIGNYQNTDVPAPARSALTDLTAWECREWFIPPTEMRFFIDKMLPTIMGHRDCQATVCPGDRAYALLPAMRTETLTKLQNLPPKVNLIAPGPGQVVRGIVDVAIQASTVVTRADYYLDSRLRATVSTAPFGWKWNTADDSEGSHTLRVVAHNHAGQGQAEVQIGVDNVPPSGTATAPPWAGSTRVGLTLTSGDAARVQFSNNWVWEGENLRHQPDSGRPVSDTAALNGQAWYGRASTDVAGAWYGPYTCELPSEREYQVYFRLKAPSRAITRELTTIDISDDQGRMVYTSRVLSGTDFIRDNVYEEFALNLSYTSRRTTCRDPNVEDGLEFRTWFRDTGDLLLDRVAVFSAPQPLASPIYWDVRPVEGEQGVIVRFLDAAGNTADYLVAVRVDLTPPTWLGYGMLTAQVQDSLSGLDTTSAQFAVSQDGGATWNAWQALSLAETPGITQPVQLAAPAVSGTHLRFRIRDMAGNLSESAPQAVLSTSTPSPTGTGAPIPTATPTPTGIATIPPYPTLPSGASRLWLPLILR